MTYTDEHGHVHDHPAGGSQYHDRCDLNDRPPVSGEPRTECRHPSVHPIDPWPDGPAWACDRCGVSFSPEASTGAALDVLDLVLLEAAHYNVFQGKLAHANLRMVVDAARNSAARLAEQEGDR